MSSEAEGVGAERLRDVGGDAGRLRGRAGRRAEDDAYRVRLERHFADLYEPFERLYGEHPAFAAQLAEIVGQIAAAHDARGEALRRLDYEREITPDWFQRQRHAGYICYVDRFAGTLAGVRERLAYLEELGVTYLHLMPLLRSRPGENDGGYAVADYREVDPRAGHDGRPERARGRPARATA